MHIIIECLLIGICCCAVCNAQHTVSTAGGEANGAGGTASYTIGQVACSTQKGSNGSIAQGVQQHYEISVVSGNAETKEIHLMVSAYPNPAMDYLVLKVEYSDKENLSYQLYDINGKSLENKMIISNETIIVMSLFSESN